MTLVDHAQRFHRAGAAVLGIGLVGVEAGRVHAGDIGAGVAVDDPVSHEPTEAATSEDADRVQTGGDEVVVHLGRRPDDRLQVGGEAFGTAEEGADTGVERGRHPAHRRFEVGPHTVPVRLD